MRISRWEGMTIPFPMRDALWVFSGHFLDIFWALAGNWKLENWALEIGRWKLGTGNWALEIGQVGVGAGLLLQRNWPVISKLILGFIRSSSF